MHSVESPMQFAPPYLANACLDDQIFPALPFWMRPSEAVMTKSAGIHHITGIAANPRRHVEFYTRVLGLRLVKRTVNFDDPGSWHLYYGNEIGAPGTALTFFIWPDAPAGRPGAGQAVETAFAIPNPRSATGSRGSSRRVFRTTRRKSGSARP